MRLLIIIAFCFSLNSYADKLSMRKCLLLPVTDSLGGALAFKVFEGVETYIKQSSWCYYRNNSEIMNILKNYRKDLHIHLENKDILKTIADRSGSGTLIKIKLKNDPKGVHIELDVIGENGQDIYFSERIHQPNDDPVVIARVIGNWLDAYEKQIPYDGKVKGILGDQVTIDMGRNAFIKVGTDFEVRREKGKKKHPLLQKVVEFESELLAKGRIFSVSEFQALGRIRTYEQKKRIDINDWVLLQKQDPASAAISDSDFPDVDKNEFGKLGIVGIDGFLGKGSSSNLVSDQNRKIGSVIFGIGFWGEVWATRNYFASLKLNRKFGSYKADSGPVSTDSLSMSQTTMRITGGYRYLPLGYFYGPQVDGYIGYVNHTYSLDTSTADQFGESSFKGFLIGIGGNVPIMKDYRIIGHVDFLLSPDYEEAITLFGDADSTSTYELEIGVQYTYSPNVSLQTSFEHTSSKAKFENPVGEISFKTQALKVGAAYTF